MKKDYLAAVSNIVYLSLLLVMIQSIFNDSIAITTYHEMHSISVKRSTLEVIHKHDLSGFGCIHSTTMILRNGDANMFSTPPMRYIWLPPDEQLIIGLSWADTGANNPQLVVWDIDGNEIHRRHISCRDEEFAKTHCFEYDGRIEWYLVSRPDLKLHNDEYHYYLSILSPEHYRCNMLDRVIAPDGKQTTLRNFLIEKKGQKYLDQLKCGLAQRFTIKWPVMQSVVGPRQHNEK